MTCSTCRHALSPSAFIPRPNRPRGFHSRCKACAAEANRAWRAERRAQGLTQRGNPIARAPVARDILTFNWSLTK